MIATDDNSQTKKEKEVAKGEDNKENNKKNKRGKPKLDAEFGVVRGIDFKKVHTVCYSTFLFFIFVLFAVWDLKKKIPCFLSSRFLIFP